ncbi:hypothetical protein KFK09_028485 [Dendrobium nobile]|uniref:Uncharacterized protein n=1 Tax=Dendrobium nobile TaxID=94219 RepID=A0A8T3A2R7_DENNO|nr:hypothetical protein KFK09_028485 [Dendrobium nobile]
MSTAKEESKPAAAGADQSGEKRPNEKVIETVDYRSPAAAADGEITEKRPVEIVHEIHDGEKDKLNAPKQD